MSPSWRTNSAETPRSDQFNLGYNCKQQKANFSWVQQNTKESVLQCSSQCRPSNVSWLQDGKTDEGHQLPAHGMNPQGNLDKRGEWIFHQVSKAWFRSLGHPQICSSFFSMWRHKTACSDFATGSPVYMFRMTPLPNSRQTKNTNKN